MSRGIYDHQRRQQEKQHRTRPCRQTSAPKQPPPPLILIGSDDDDDDGDGGKNADEKGVACSASDQEANTDEEEDEGFQEQEEEEEEDAEDDGDDEDKDDGFDRDHGDGGDGEASAEALAVSHFSALPEPNAPLSPPSDYEHDCSVTVTGLPPDLPHHSSDVSILDALAGSLEAENENSLPMFEHQQEQQCLDTNKNLANAAALETLSTGAVVQTEVPEEANTTDAAVASSVSKEPAAAAAPEISKTDQPLKRRKTSTTTAVAPIVRVHKSPMDLLNKLVPLPYCSLSINHNDHRFSSKWRSDITCEFWICELANVSFTRSFNYMSEESWTKALKEVHSRVWTKWQLNRENLPIDLPEQEPGEISPAIMEELKQVVCNLPPPKEYKRDRV